MNHLGVVPTSAPSFPLSAQRFFTLQIPAESEFPAFMPKRKNFLSAALLIFFATFKKEFSKVRFFVYPAGFHFLRVIVFLSLLSACFSFPLPSVDIDIEGRL